MNHNFKSLRAQRSNLTFPTWLGRLLRPLGLAMTCVLILSATTHTASAAQVEKIVAVVGSDVATLYDLDRAIAPYMSEINKSPNKEQKYKEVKAEMLDRIVNNLLLKQAIEQTKIPVTNDEVARAIKNILAQNNTTIEALKAELVSKGISYESYKDDIKQNIQRVKFMNQEIGSRVKISDQDMKDYYQKHMDEFGGRQSAHIAQIVLPFDEGTTKEKAQILKTKAQDIVNLARSGTSFASLAKQYSKGPNAEKGGDLGVVDPSHLLPEIAAALEKMGTGQISDPIVSTAGIHIIDLIDRAKASEGDFEKMKDAIYNKMYDQRVADELNQYLADARKKTYVEIRD